MLFLLTILGLWVLDTSNTDLKIAGNLRCAQNAFYVAESGVGYATNTAIITLASNSVGAATYSSSVSFPTGTAVFTVVATGLGYFNPNACKSMATDMQVDLNKAQVQFYSVVVDGQGSNNCSEVVELSMCRPLL